MPPGGFAVSRGTPCGRKRDRRQGLRRDHVVPIRPCGFDPGAATASGSRAALNSSRAAGKAILDAMGTPRLRVRPLIRPIQILAESRGRGTEALCQHPSQRREEASPGPGTEYHQMHRNRPAVSGPCGGDRQRVHEELQVDMVGLRVPARLRHDKDGKNDFFGVLRRTYRRSGRSSRRVLTNPGSDLMNPPTIDKKSKRGDAVKRY